jgi:citrate synthase
VDTKNANSKKTAKLLLDDKEYELPIVVGTENEHAIDITELRGQSGYITLDEGYRNTGSVQSRVTFIDGEKGILRYRGIPIEQLAKQSTFVETALLLIFGELPTSDQLAHFKDLLTQHEMIHEGMRHSFQGFPPAGHPMATLSAMLQPGRHGDGRSLGRVRKCGGPTHVEDPYGCRCGVQDVGR